MINLNVIFALVAFAIVGMLKVETVVTLSRRQLSPIIWSTENNIFKSNLEENHVINVRIGEFLNIICPKYFQDSQETTQVEYHTIYMVNKHEFDECKLKPTVNTPRLLVRCDRPFDSLKYTLYISKFSPVPDAIEFVEGKDYYIISTSDGTQAGLNNTDKGTCISHHMKLLIRVNDDKKSKSSPIQYPSNTKHVHSKALLSSETTRSFHHSKRLTSTSTKSISISTTKTQAASLFQSNRKIAEISAATPMVHASNQPYLNINMKELSATNTIATSTSLKTANDIFILEPIDNANDYSEFLNQLISSSSNSFIKSNKTNSDNNNIVNEKQLASSSSSSSAGAGATTIAAANRTSLKFVYFFSFFFLSLLFYVNVSN